MDNCKTNAAYLTHLQQEGVAVFPLGSWVEGVSLLGIQQEVGPLADE